VDRVRRAYALRRVGHAGTLDPFASGLLLVLLGRATRLAQYLVGLPKTYQGRIRLGAVTDTDDCTGTVLRTSEDWQALSGERIGGAMRQFVGVHLQRPPAYSAKKTSGQRAHRLARKGAPVELAPVSVEVRRFDLRGHEGASVAFSAEVGSGTYLRALARDLGERLGCGAHLEELRRTRIGAFAVEDALPWDAVTGGTEPVRPPRDAVAHLPRRALVDAECDLVRHGRALDAADCPDTPIALLADGVLVAVAHREGDLLKPRVVLGDA
jgi:tRNA pseudouridine55 synthase